MSLQVRIGVACPIPAERAAFLEWLSAAGYDPVPMLDLDSMARELSARPVEALIADADLVPTVDLPRVVRLLGGNRPLILVGSPGSAREVVPRDATWVERPVTEGTFLLLVALALAEGRPTRRSPRKFVRQLHSTIDGVDAKVMDVSAEGVRLEVSAAQRAALPPYFTLRVPGFGVVAKVKRVWVAMPPIDVDQQSSGADQGRPKVAVWCGGIIDKTAVKAKTGWGTFVETAPSTAEITTRESRPSDQF